MRGNQINLTFKQDSEEQSLYMWLKSKKNHGIFIKNILLKIKEMESNGYQFSLENTFQPNFFMTSNPTVTTLTQPFQSINQLEQSTQINRTTLEEPKLQSPATSSLIDFGEWGAE